MAQERLNKFDLTTEERKEVIEFIRTHTDIHVCLDGGINEFDLRLKIFSDSHQNIIDYLLFGLADIYGSYLEVSNPKEYLYRTHVLLSTIKNMS